MRVSVAASNTHNLHNILKPHRHSTMDKQTGLLKPSVQVMTQTSKKKTPTTSPTSYIHPEHSPQRHTQPTEPLWPHLPEAEDLATVSAGPAVTHTETPLCYCLRSSLCTHAFHRMDSKDSCTRCVNASNKNVLHAPSTKTECDYPNGWIKKQSHAQKSLPKWRTPET